jgi:ribosome biogenesis GTPase / thiamine phosphate phosphatase
MPDPGLTLETLGWNATFAESFARLGQKGLEPGRVAVEDKHYYVIVTRQGELTGQVSGKMLHQARTPAELPKVGDWVAVSPLAGEAKAVIHHVLERRTRLSRKVPGREVEEQVLATNIDKAFVVQALDSTFNPGLLQRHLVMVSESGAEPVVVLNKADLCDAVADRVAQARNAVGEAPPMVVASAKTGAGLEDLAQRISPGTTVVFIGSSGVGKSTLINDLCGEEIQATAEVRERDAKGRHTTTWRELILLPQGGLVIDTPGMREFQMWMANEGMRDTFSDLETLANQCHFRNCTHTVETRCAVLEAVTKGELTRDRYARFLKLQTELAFLREAQTKHGWIQRRRQGRVAQRAFEKLKRNLPE